MAGDNPPYHTPVFVLTHQARDSITMEGGTTFHFITMESTLRWTVPKKRQTDWMFGLAAGSQQSSNTCERV